MSLTAIFCTPVLSFDTPCVTLPGGIEICAQQIELGDPSAILRSFLSQINTALAPLGPIFLIIEVVITIKDVIEAVPKLIGPPPDPEKFFKALAKLIELIGELVGIAPQLSVPKMVKQIIAVILLTCQAVKLDLTALVRQLVRVLNAATKGARPGNNLLDLAALCAQGVFDATLANLTASLQPVNQLIGIVNLLLDLAQVPKEARIPSFDSLGEDAEAALSVMDTTINILQTVYDAIPL
ncbi:MAG: hypothetical protein EKK55_05965 [Rhodocyclaceae bacterium]|nr:MAG: hypothetical protein EKK55_05965 [Rhodocyclaceae bacterium]